MAIVTFGEAIRRILEHRDYQAWEDVWGLTSKYWKRRGGADHILVFSEPLQGTVFCSLPRAHDFIRLTVSWFPIFEQACGTKATSAETINTFIHNNNWRHP